MYSSIKPGQIWNDTSGKPIQAHGFSVFYDEKQKTYYWFGENKELTKGGKKNTIWTYGIRLYTSKDLYNWEDKGLIIKPSEDLKSPLHPTYQIDRPHIIYNEKTRKYVCWIKIMAGEVSQFMTILTADQLEGPYTIVKDIYKPLNMDSGDFALHVDKDTKKAYIFFERPHFQLITATLDEDYTGCSGEYSVHYDGLFPPETREAPTYFEHDGKKYLITSGTSGYFPNVSRACVFDDYHGEYKDLGDISINDKTNTTFNSQITCVLKVPGTEKYIAMADRWMPQWYIPKMSKMIINGMKRRYADYKPDTSEKLPQPLSEKLSVHRENTSISRYVWLPLDWEGEKPVLRWTDEWKTEDFN